MAGAACDVAARIRCSALACADRMSAKCLYEPLSVRDMSWSYITG